MYQQFDYTLKYIVCKYANLKMEMFDLKKVVISCQFTQNVRLQVKLKDELSKQVQYLKV